MTVVAALTSRTHGHNQASRPKATVTSAARNAAAVRQGCHLDHKWAGSGVTGTATGLAATEMDGVTMNDDDNNAE
jgi:hypothetical protein